MSRRVPYGLIPALFAAGPLLLLFGGRAFAAEAPKPDIVVILTDDLGFSDLGCYGNAFNETPRIDRLAGGPLA